MTSTTYAAITNGVDQLIAKHAENDRASAAMPVVPPRVRQAVHEVAEAHGLAPELLFGRTRSAKLWAARRETWIALRSMKCRDHGPFSFPQIGGWFGRHHTTIVHGVASHGSPRNRGRKLSDSDLFEARWRLSLGELHYVVAADLGVSDGTLRINLAREGRDYQPAGYRDAGGGRD